MSGATGAYRPTLPLGVAIISIVIGLFAFLILIAGVVVLAFSAVGVGLDGFHYFGEGFLGGLLLIVFAVVLFVVAVGLWGRELWALALCVIVVGVLWLSDVLQGGVFSFGAIILLLLLVYLVLVRHHFR
ncbi:MAG: hypothetical protein L3K19_03780 [Thermoplasmata archaeon]|nr:hypothetical protein [Thermoplasmata archaeon]